MLNRILQFSVIISESIKSEKHCGKSTYGLSARQKMSFVQQALLIADSPPNKARKINS